MTSLRITGGALRGRRVPVPKGEVRPTSERARQAYFNIVGDRIQDAAFLDLFAGSGIFSFEAVSRGAASATAIDVSRRNASAIAELARELDCAITTIAADVTAGISRLGGAVFGLVYADPPYAYDAYDGLLEAIDTKVSLAPGALVAIEHRRRTEPFSYNPQTLRLDRRAEYGEVWITFFIA